MIMIKYIGGLDGVDINLPSGRSVTMVRDEVISVMLNEAESLEGNPEFEIVNGDTDDLNKTNDEKDAD